jgi:hypothetical protein
LDRVVVLVSFFRILSFRKERVLENFDHRQSWDRMVFSAPCLVLGQLVYSSVLQGH